MASLPGRNNLPQETSTPLKKGVRCNAFSTPTKSTLALDCQEVVADFKIFLDELGIGDCNDQLDDEADSTLEDELSKLETTLKNIELEYSGQEVINDSEKQIKCSDCEDQENCSLEVPVAEAHRNHTEIKSQSGLHEETSDHHSAKKIVENDREQNTEGHICKDSPRSAVTDSSKMESEAEFLTLDASGEMSVEISTHVLTEDTLNSESKPLQDIQQNINELGNTGPTECTGELVCSELVCSDSPAETDCLTLDQTGNISDKDLVSQDDSVQIVFEVRRKLDKNDAVTLKKTSFVKPYIVNQTKCDGIPSIECGKTETVVVNSNSVVDISPSIVKDEIKDGGVTCKEGDKCIGVKLETKVFNPQTNADETTVVNVNNVADVCPSDTKDISSKATHNEIYTSTEINSDCLQTDKECLTVVKKNSDSQSIVLKGKTIKSPRKCLNDINKENEMVVCHSATVTSKLLHQLAVETNKENILAEAQVGGTAAKDNDRDTKKEVVRVAEEFISLDPEENRDNNSEKWEELRKLTTDPERYRALRKRWQNISNPDPNKNLTTRRCFRKNFIRKKLTAKLVPKKLNKFEEFKCDDADIDLLRTGRKRKCVGDSQGQPDVKRPKTYLCTILYDEQMAVVTETMNKELNSVNKEEHEALTRLSLSQNREQENLRNREGYLYRLTPNAVQLRNRQDTETLFAMEHFHKKKQRIEEARNAELSKLKSAADEIYAFHSFYNGITEDNVNTLLLTEEQVLHLRDIEDYYNKMYEIYDNSGA